jgi:hypothetical protein
MAGSGEHVRRSVRYLLILSAVCIVAVLLILAWSIYTDQQGFGSAKNDCERACIQDSGGLEQCRALCVQHPDHYP